MIISEWNETDCTLPCGHKLVHHAKGINDYGYFLEQPLKCPECTSQWEKVQLAGWDRRTLEFARSDGRLQTCPSRLSQCGPWKMEENLDWWEIDNWGMRSSDRWPEPFPKPRTCNFCGGVHPDDVVKLIDQHGWEVEATDKSYKRYIHPPGYHARIAAMLKGPYGDVPKAMYVDPVPPVKLYIDHFTPEQIKAFNAALTKQLPPLSKRAPDEPNAPAAP